MPATYTPPDKRKSRATVYSIDPQTLNPASSDAPPQPRRAAYTPPHLRAPVYTAAPQKLNPTPPIGDDRLTADDAELAARQAATSNTDLPTSSMDSSALLASIPSPRRAVYNPPTSASPSSTPPSFVEDAAARLRSDLNSPVEDENGRGKSALRLALAGGGQGAQNGSLGQAVGGMIAGAVTGLIRPKTDEVLIDRPARIRRDQAALQTETALDKQRRENLEGDAKLDLMRSEAEKNRRQPATKPHYFKQGGVTYRSSDDGSNATPVVGANGEALLPDVQRPVYIDMLGSDGVTMTRNQYNPATQKYEPVTVDGTPAVVKLVERVDPGTGMKASQAAADSDRDAARGERVRHDQVTEVQGVQRIGETRRHNVVSEGQGERRVSVYETNAGQPTARETNTRLARAAELNRKLEEEKNKAAHPPYSINGQATSDAYRAGYTARHKQAAAGYRDQIKSAYSDVYETGDDGNGWAYAKPKATPQTRVAAPAPAAPAPQRMRMREADIPNAVDDLIKAGRYKDRKEAEAYVRANVEVVKE